MFLTSLDLEKETFLKLTMYFHYYVIISYGSGEEDNGENMITMRTDKGPVMISTWAFGSHELKRGHTFKNLSLKFYFFAVDI